MSQAGRWSRVCPCIENNNGGILMKLFVPGRICLFGEHSDWAGSYRRINAELEKGYTLIAGTNQGLYADVRPHPAKLIFHSTMPDGTRKTFETLMNPESLLAEAEKGGYFATSADHESLLAELTLR